MRNSLNIKTTIKRTPVFNNDRVELTSYELYSPKVTREVVIAHLSDLHEKEFGRGNAGLLHEVHALRPDFIAVTGDIAAHEIQKSPPSAYVRTLARGLCSIAPTYFVTGNHDRMFSAEISDAFACGGAKTLRGGIERLYINDGAVNISGMDDISHVGASVNEATCGFAKKEGYNVFLAHRPEFFKQYLNRNIDLVLCGHTHAGQIRFPWLGALAVHGQGLLPRYSEGKFTDGQTTMIISRGLGSSGYPAVRINNPPDLVAVHIRNSKDVQ